METSELISEQPNTKEAAEVWARLKDELKSSEDFRVMTTSMTNYTFMKACNLLQNSKIYPSFSELVRHALSDMVLELFDASLKLDDLYKADNLKRASDVQKARIQLKMAHWKEVKAQQIRELNRIKAVESNEELILDSKHYHIVKNKPGRSQQWRAGF